MIPLPRKSCAGVLICLMALLGAAHGATPAAPTGPRALSVSGPTPAPGATGLAGGTGIYGPGAVSPLQLLRVTRPNLAVFFPFDRDCYAPNNSAVPLDLSPNSRTVFNFGGYMWRGRLRDGMRFGLDAVGVLRPAYLVVPQMPVSYDLDMTGVCTMAAWVSDERPGGLTGSGDQAIMCRGATDQDNTVSYCLGLTSAMVPFIESWAPSSAWRRMADRQISAGWQHVCVVFSGGSVSFYINGQLAGQSKAPAPSLRPLILNSQVPLFIAARFASQVTGEIRDPYFGILDDVALWNRALTPIEISALASDVNGNGISDYWDTLITGIRPAPIPGAPGTVTPTPTISSPYRSITGPQPPNPTAPGSKSSKVTPKPTPSMSSSGSSQQGPSGPNRRGGPGGPPPGPSKTPTPTPLPGSQFR